MKTKQTILIPKKLKKYKGLKSKDIRIIRKDEWSLWYLTQFHFIKKKLEVPNWILVQRLKYLYEMLSTDQPKTQKTNMEQIRSKIRRISITTMRKMRGMHQPENNGMELQTRQ